jgi:RNA-directed DNA polymerase
MKKINEQETRWASINWRSIDQYLFKLQKRIYESTINGKTKDVHKFQKILISSQAAKLRAVRRVTQDNRGKKTAGVDGINSLTPAQRLKTAFSLQVDGKSSPIRRVYIPKPNGEERPLGIPTIQDRAKQTLVLMSLEPEWEAVTGTGMGSQVRREQLRLQARKGKPRCYRSYLHSHKSKGEILPGCGHRQMF